MNEQNTLVEDMMLFRHSINNLRVIKFTMMELVFLKVLKIEEMQAPTKTSTEDNEAVAESHKVICAGENLQNFQPKKHQKALITALMNKEQQICLLSEYIQAVLNEIEKDLKNEMGLQIIFQSPKQYLDIWLRKPSELYDGLKEKGYLIENRQYKLSPVGQIRRKRIQKLLDEVNKSLSENKYKPNPDALKKAMTEAGVYVLLIDQASFKQKADQTIDSVTPVVDFGINALDCFGEGLLGDAFDVISPLFVSMGEVSGDIIGAAGEVAGGFIGGAIGAIFD